MAQPCSRRVVQLDTSVEAFRAYVYAVRSQATAIKYAQAAHRFLLFTGRHGLSIDRLTPGVLSLFAESLLHEGLKPGSVATMVAGARKYLEWCRSKGTGVPTLGKTDLPRTHLPSPNALRGDVLMGYLALASRLHEPVRTALLILPYCGLRSFELTGLQLSNIQQLEIPKQGGSQRMLVFSVVGKGGKRRIVPLLLDGKPLLIQYLAGWRRRFAGTWLFPSGPKGRTAISPRTLRWHVQRIAKALGGVRLTPHTLRRTYLTTLYKQGLDPATLTKIAGHRSIQTTYEHYLAIEPDEIAGSVSGMRLVARGPQEARVQTASGTLGAFLSGTSKGRAFDVPVLEPIEEGENE